MQNSKTWTKTVTTDLHQFRLFCKDIARRFLFHVILAQFKRMEQVQNKPQDRTSYTYYDYQISKVESKESFSKELPLARMVDRECQISTMKTIRRWWRQRLIRWNESHQFNPQRLTRTQSYKFSSIALAVLRTCTQVESIDFLPYGDSRILDHQSWKGMTVLRGNIRNAKVKKRFVNFIDEFANGEWNFLSNIIRDPGQNPNSPRLSISMSMSKKAGPIPQNFCLIFDIEWDHSLPRLNIMATGFRGILIERWPKRSNVKYTFIVRH
jgi:hypothetical protein